MSEVQLSLQIQGDIFFVSRTGTAYPPVTSTGGQWPGLTGFGGFEWPAKLKTGSTYQNACLIARFPTNSIADDATIVGARLKYWIEHKADADNRLFEVEWFPTSPWPTSEANMLANVTTYHVQTLPSVDGSEDITGLTLSTFEEITISGAAANISKTAPTAIRCAISGGAPTAFNNATCVKDLPPDFIDAIFLIVEFSLPPNAPTRDARDPYDGDDDATFGWTFDDPDNEDTQGAYQVEIRRVSDNALMYDSGESLSSQEFIVLAGGTLDNDDEYKWRVRTWDNHDVEGPYSSYGTFWCSAAPTTNITDPTAAEVITGPNTTLSWTYSDPEAEAQRAHQVVLTNLTAAPDEIVLDTGKQIQGSVLFYELTDLENAIDFRAAVTTWDAKDVPHTDTVDFETLYTPPPTPVVTLTEFDDLGYIEVDTSTAAPTGGQPTVDHLDIYRRVAGETDWVRVATGVADDTEYDDYAVASGVSYEYKVRAIGEDSSSADSDTETGSVILSAGIYLFDPLDVAGTAHKYLTGMERGDSSELGAQMLTFAGRTFAVAEFGENETATISFMLRCLLETSDAALFETLYQSKRTLCYRDDRGRKMYGVVLGRNVEDTEIAGEITATFLQTNHDEAV